MPEDKKKTKRVQRWVNEFKEFAMRGNVIDLAVGIIIGGAFGKITSSLVEDVFIPIVGIFFGGVKFENFKIILPPTPLGSDNPLTLNLGKFISVVVDFFLMALCVFFMVKIINTLRRKMLPETPKEPEAPKEPETPPDIALLTEIRDLLRDNKLK